jgi:hypothetical protein
MSAAPANNAVLNRPMCISPIVIQLQLGRVAVSVVGSRQHITLP